MIRLALAAACLSGCVTMVAKPSSFKRGTPAQSAMVFGRFLVGGQPVQELRLGQFEGGLAETGVNAMLDARGNFAFVVEPGAYYLHWYEPRGGRPIILDSAGPPLPVFHFQVRAGELHWLGAWEEASYSRAKVELKRKDDVQPLEVLKALATRAAGTAWEAPLRQEIERYLGATSDNL